MRDCGFPDCGRPYYANGRCEAHDRQAARNRPLKPIREKAAPGSYGPTCALTDCGKRHYAKGFCRSHYGSYCRSQLTTEERERRRERDREYARANRVAFRVHTNKSDARRKSAPMLEFTTAQVMERMAYWGNRCWICSGPFESIDHVKPIAKGGWHILANLRPSCRPCNNRKCARWPLSDALLAAVRERRPWNPAEEVAGAYLHTSG